MQNLDSNNGIDHKCPCCGYEVEFGVGFEFVKGDQSFIVIRSNAPNSNYFYTDKPRNVDWGRPDTERVILLGCPKCGGVSFVLY